MFGRAFPSVLCLLAVACALQHGACAANDEPDRDLEWHLKTSYLYRLSTCVHWPEGAGGEFVIAVFGRNRLEPWLIELAKTKKIDDKKIVWRHWKSIDDFQACHVVFIAAEAVDARSKESAGDRLAAVLKKTQGKGPLIVTESEGLITKGAMINLFVNSEGKMKFEVHLDAARRAGLQFKPGVLSSAAKVHRDLEKNSEHQK